jgi:catechol 2,3-dioxygenase-like lactoylglutathione lyase family enzyme
MTSLQNTSPARLHHLHLTSEDPPRLARFYTELMDMEPASLPQGEGKGAILLHGGLRSMQISKGASCALAWSAYALRDEAGLAALRAGLKARGAKSEDIDAPLFRKGAFIVADPQGRRVVFGLAADTSRTDQRAARTQHVVFQTTDLDAMVAFYTGTLGFTVSDRVIEEDGSLAVCFMRSDDEHHSVAFFRGSRNELDHHCYETSGWMDIRDWGDRFAKLRIPIFFGPGRHGPGDNLFFMVNDPDGNKVELSAEIERVAADKPAGVWPQGEYTLNSWGRAWMRS